jgi:hypothetical protein
MNANKPTRKSAWLEVSESIIFRLSSG